MANACKEMSWLRDDCMHPFPGPALISQHLGEHSFCNPNCANAGFFGTFLHLTSLISTKLPKTRGGVGVFAPLLGSRIPNLCANIVRAVELFVCKSGWPGPAINSSSSRAWRSGPCCRGPGRRHPRPRSFWGRFRRGRRGPSSRRSRGGTRRPQRRILPSW